MPRPADDAPDGYPCVCDGAVSAQLLGTTANTAVACTGHIGAATGAEVTSAAQISMHGAAIESTAHGATVMDTQTIAVAHTMSSEGPGEQIVADVPTATVNGVGVQRRYITRAKSVSRVTVSSDTRGALPRKMPRTASPRKMPHAACDFESMDAENTRVLTQDEPGTWINGVWRFRITGQSASDMLSWVVENTSRTLSVITTDGLWLDGFHNWEAVHSRGLDAARQLQHTFVIPRAHRRRALKIIPGLNTIVAAAQAEIESKHLHDTPQMLEWLTGHILNQGDVNARFTYHKDTTEERNAVGGRRDRHVLYTAIIKLNRGGCTSMQVCGHPEVFYLAPGGSGVIFRSDLHHRTEKAELGIWKIALFFGVFL